MAEQIATTLQVTGDDLPNELLLLIYPLLPLRSLIAARGVSRRWRSLVCQADLDPARRRLLELYLLAISCPIFRQSRPQILPRIQSFDRDEYMSSIPKHAVPPRDFELWIREWPEKAAIGWIWPGLGQETYMGESTTFQIHGLCNYLGHIPPYIKTATYHQRKPIISGVRGTGDTDGDLPEVNTFHATTFLPADIEIPLPPPGQISWLDDEEEEEVSIEVTALCVSEFVDGEKHWMVLDGKRGGELMKGSVYRGGYEMGPEDIVARSWSEYMEQELYRAKQFAIRKTT